MNNACRIDCFEGAYRFLSNFWFTPVVYDGYIYSTVEHAYQAAKFDDLEIQKQIRQSVSAADAKKLGRTFPKECMRKDWHDVRLTIMNDLVLQKFLVNASARRALLATEDMELIEGNTWGDTYWGVCNGVGSNKLGIILMEARKQLREWQLYEKV